MQGGKVLSSQNLEDKYCHLDQDFNKSSNSTMIIAKLDNFVHSLNALTRGRERRASVEFAQSMVTLGLISIQHEDRNSHKSTTQTHDNVVYKNPS